MYRLIFALMLNGCVHWRLSHSYMDFYEPKSQQYLELRQCSLPITVSFNSLMEHDKAKIRDGLSFWEHHAGQKLFVESNEARVVFENSTESYYGRAGGITHNTWDSKGCILLSRVKFMYPLASLSEWDAQFIVRHELGHVLGLDDSYDQLNIMYQFVDINVREPSNLEVKALRRFYGLHAPIFTNP